MRLKFMKTEVLQNGLILQQMIGRDIHEEELRDLSVLDNKVFCGAPWFEGDFCDVCSGMRKTELFNADTEVCVECGTNVITLRTRVRKIQDELVEDLSYVAVLKNGENIVVGYSFGYRFATPEEFVNSKYKTVKTQTAVLTALRNSGITSDFYYYSGMGIDSNYRGQGLSYYIGKAVDDYARSLGLKGLTRTLHDSPIVKMREKLGFKAIVGPHIEPQADFENSKRVLLIRE